MKYNNLKAWGSNQHCFTKGNACIEAYVDVINTRLNLCSQLIESTDLASGGSYTAVGTYPSSEMVSLVVRLSELTNVPVRPLL